MNSGNVPREEEYIKEPKDGLIRYGPKVVEQIRKDYNLDKRENRDKAIAIINEWIKQQDHFVKKDFSKGYIERCLATSKGSIERAKIQIDRMCTFRTLMPKYFQTINIKNCEYMEGWKLSEIAYIPQLTEEYYRIIFVKLKPNAVLRAENYTLLYKLMIMMGEYSMTNEYCRGYIMINDFYDTNVSELIYKINLVELQQFLPILTKGYGLKIKGIYMITSSKAIEGFLNMFKKLFSTKVANRIHALTSRKELRNVINGDILPVDYGGPEKSMTELNHNFIESLSSEYMQKLLEENHKAVTDESKRETYQFNDKYMGMPGSFRTLSLD